MAPRPLPFLPTPRSTPPAGGNAGFTLIEIVLTMVILAVIGSMAGIGIYQVTRGFVFSRANTEAAAKAQLAMLRLVKEGINIKGVVSGTTSALTFTTQHGTPSSPVDVTYTVALNGSTLTLNDGVHDDALLDGVTAFSLQYYDTYDGTATTTWGASSRIIEISITVLGADNEQATFTARIRPRNI